MLTVVIGLGRMSKTMHTQFSQHYNNMSTTTSTTSTTSSLPCPFIGDDVRIDLQGQELSLEQKKYLGQQLASRTATVHAFQWQYNLPRTRLYKYRNKMKMAAAHGIPATIYEKSGRPRCLDARSEYEIAHTLQLEPTMTERQLRSLIREKSVKSSEATILRQQKKTISMRSVRRYSKSLRQMASNMCQVVESIGHVTDPKNDISHYVGVEDDRTQNNTGGEQEMAATGGSSRGSLGDYVNYFYTAFWSNH